MYSPTVSPTSWSRQRARLTADRRTSLPQTSCSSGLGVLATGARLTSRLRRLTRMSIPRALSTAIEFLPAVLARQKDDGQGAAGAAQLRQEVNAGNRRQDPVQYDEIGAGQLVERCQKPRAVGEALDRKAAFCQLPAERLAEIIVLDQFSRNIHRHTPAAFAQDPIALVLAQEAVRQQP